jgi:predicted MFS family arabinose efflux permease
MGFADPVLPVYASSFGISYALVGAVMSAFGLSRLFFEIPSGILTDRIGIKPLLLIGYAVTPLAYLLSGAASSFPLLFAARMLVGAASSISFTASLVFVTNIAPSAHRSTYIARFQSTFFVSGVLGPTVGGVLTEVLSLRTLFFVASVVATLGIAVIAFLPVPPTTADARSRGVGHVGALLLDRRVVTLGLATLTLFLTFSSIRATLLPIYIVTVLGYSSLNVGLYFSFTSVVILLTLLLVTHRIERRVGGPSLLLGSLACCAASVLLLSVASDFPTLLLCSVPFGVGLGLLQPTPFALLPRFTRPEQRGLAMGVMRTIGDVGLLVGPLLVGWFIDLGYPTLAFYSVSGVIGITTIIAGFVFARRT